MRKLMSMVLLAALLTLTIAAGKGPGPKATGDASWTNTNRGFTVHAVFDAQLKNGDAKGNVQVTVEGNLDLAYTGTVTCYVQDDNEATFSGTIDEQTGADANSSTHFVITVIDNGEGANAPADKIATNRINSENCTPIDPVNEVDEGNIQVHPES